MGINKFLPLYCTCQPKPKPKMRTGVSVATSARAAAAWADMSSQEPSLDDVRSLCRRLAEASPCHSAEDDDRCRRLGLALDRHFKAALNEHIGSAAGRPLLISYQSDATSFLTRTQVETSTEQGSLQRRGRSLQEFLSERCLLKSVEPSGDVRMTVSMRPPRKLDRGKTTGNHFSAACFSVPLLRQSGHTGISITHVCFDRALHHSLSKLLLARRNAYYDSSVGVYEDEHESFLGSLRDWCLETGCAAHDGSNGLKWGMAPWGNGDVQDNLFIACESLRNNFHHLARHLCSWLPAVVAFDRAVDDTEEAIWWRALGIPCTWVEDFVEVGAVWSSGQLRVRDSLRNDPEAFAKISRIWMWAMRWRKLCITRWVTVGLASRALLRTLALGLPALMQQTSDDPLVSQYHAHGFSRCGPEEQQFTAIAAMASYPIESWLAEVVLDDRIGRRAEELGETLLEEVQFVEDLPRSFWQRLESAVNLPSWHNLRSAVLEAIHTSISYIHHKTLKKASGLPWSLCRGDIKANLREFAAKDLPPDADSVSSSIKGLLTLGVSEMELVDAISLLGEVGWTTKAAEQLHGSIAVVHRLHKDLDSSSLSLRAYIHACRALFQEDPDEKRLARLRAACDRLGSDRGRCVSAQNMFFRNMLARLRAKKAKGKPLPCLQKEALTTCQRRYNTLPNQLKRRYVAMAEEDPNPYRYPANAPLRGHCTKAPSFFGF